MGEHLKDLNLDVSGCQDAVQLDLAVDQVLEKHFSTNNRGFNWAIKATDKKLNANQGKVQSDYLLEPSSSELTKYTLSSKLEYIIFLKEKQQIESSKTSIGRL